MDLQSTSRAPVLPRSPYMQTSNFTSSFKPTVTCWSGCLPPFSSGELIFGLPDGSDGKRNLPPRHETWFQPLGQEDFLENGMATHSSILAWRILWAEEPGKVQSLGLQRVGQDWATNTQSYIYTSRPSSKLVNDLSFTSALPPVFILSRQKLGSHPCLLPYPFHHQVLAILLSQ